MLRYIIICLGIIGVSAGIELEQRTITKKTAGEVIQGKISYIKGTDIKHGREAWYNEDGHLTEQMHFVNGRKEGREIKYSKEGEVIYDANYKNNKLQGVVLEFYPHNILKSEITYDEGAIKDKANGIIKMAHLPKKRLMSMVCLRVR